MRLVDLRLGIDPDCLHDRFELLSETAKRLLRFPDIHNAEAGSGFSCGVNEQALDGPVRRRLQAALPTGELTNRIAFLNVVRATASYEIRASFRFAPVKSQSTTTGFCE